MVTPDRSQLKVKQNDNFHNSSIPALQPYPTHHPPPLPPPPPPPPPWPPWPTLSESSVTPYSSMTVVPLCITPLPVIIHVPDRMFVIVDGKSREVGACVVTPISTEPAHLSTIRSSRTSNSSPGRRGRLVSATPLLKSSAALHTGDSVS